MNNVHRITATRPRPHAILCAIQVTASALALALMSACATPNSPEEKLLAEAPTAAGMPKAEPSLTPKPEQVPAPEPAPAVEVQAAPEIAPIIDPLVPDAVIDLLNREANADLWGRVRKRFAMVDLETDLVRKHEQWYAGRPAYVDRMTQRGSLYLYHIVEEVERRGMPSELALLPFIESAFNPQAMSVAKASGIWQFMSATGKDFDLKQNIFRDDRRDVLASTRAALDYLQKLHDQFDDWHLALAAYNWGQGNVQRAIARNQRAGLGTDYLSLRNRMPPETQNYVPKLQAIKNIVARPDSFGLILPVVRNHPYFLAVPIERDMDVELAARFSGMPLDEFRALNPQLNKPVILAAGTPRVLLPYDNAAAFVEAIAQHRAPLASWTAWVAPKTLKPADAAKLVGMPEAHLRELNRIPNRMMIKAGSTLLVPRHGNRQEDVPETIADHATMALAPEGPALKRVSFKASKGATVQSVARRYKVPAQQVAQWNSVGAKASFKAGQTVVVYLPQRAKASKVASTKKARPTARVASTRKQAPRAAGRQASRPGHKSSALAQSGRKDGARVALKN